MALYKLHKIEGGYAVRHKVQNKDIQLFKGMGAKARATEFKRKLEEKAAQNGQ